MTFCRMSLGGDSQGTEVEGFAGQVGRGLKIAVHGRMRVSLAAPRRCQVHGSGFDVVALQSGWLAGPKSGGNVVHQQGKIAGVEVERNITILEIEAGGAVFVAQNAFLDQDVTGPQIEEGIQRRNRLFFVACGAWAGWLSRRDRR